MRIYKLLVIMLCLSILGGCSNDLTPAVLHENSNAEETGDRDILSDIEDIDLTGTWYGAQFTHDTISLNQDGTYDSVLFSSGVYKLNNSVLTLSSRSGDFSLYVFDNEGLLSMSYQDLTYTKEMEKLDQFESEYGDEGSTVIISREEYETVIKPNGSVDGQLEESDMTETSDILWFSAVKQILSAGLWIGDNNNLLFQSLTESSTYVCSCDCQVIGFTFLKIKNEGLEYTVSIAVDKQTYELCIKNDDGGDSYTLTSDLFGDEVFRMTSHIKFAEPIIE